MELIDEGIQIALDVKKKTGEGVSSKPVIHPVGVVVCLGFCVQQIHYADVLFAYIDY